MILWPCLHCPKHTACEQKAALMAQFKGAGLTTASHRCREPYDMFPPGSRVQATFRIQGDYDHYEEGCHESEEDIAGTVMHRRGRKLVLWLDEAPGEHHIVKLYPDRLTKIDGFVPVCSECGCPEGEVNDEKWYCWKCNGFESFDASIGKGLTAWARPPDTETQT